MDALVEVLRGELGALVAGEDVLILRVLLVVRQNLDQVQIPYLIYLPLRVPVLTLLELAFKVAFFPDLRLDRGEGPVQVVLSLSLFPLVLSSF